MTFGGGGGEGAGLLIQDQDSSASVTLKSFSQSFILPVSVSVGGASLTGGSRETRPYFKEKTFAGFLSDVVLPL